MTEILFIVRPPTMGFMDTDVRLLRTRHSVTVEEYPDRLTPRALLRLWRLAWRADAGYTYFASDHALLGALPFRLRRRPFVVAVGGYDTANDPVHGYGLAARRRGWLPRLVVRLATSLIAHSDFARGELRALTGAGASKTSTTYLAVDVEEWADPGVARRAEQVITVATVNPESYRRKGIDRFVELARLDPSRAYVLVGHVDPAVREGVLRDPPANLSLVGSVDHDELRTLLWSASIYAQLSWHETFGTSVVEALACGCIPLISDQAALVEVTGGLGIVASADDPAATIAALDALAPTHATRAALRDRVVTTFSPGLRLEALERALVG